MKLDLITNILFRSMINPNNKEFYLNSLTFEQFEQLLDYDPVSKDDYVNTVWEALELAQAYLIQEEIHERERQNKLS